MLRPMYEDAVDPALGRMAGSSRQARGKDIASRPDPVWSAAPSARSGPRAQPFATIIVHATLEAADDSWSVLEAIAVMSPYQRRDWVAAWIETDGRAANLTPMIVVAYDAAGTPIALLPLGLQRAGRLRQAVFLGGRQTNYNMGLFDPRVAWTTETADRLLRQAARLVPGGVDLYALAHQPERWGDLVNPLAGLPRSQPSPSFSHRAVLQRDAEAFLKARQSGAARKKLRSKAANMAALGPVEHRVARTRAEIDAVLTAHIEQKAAKLTELGIPVPDGAALRQLLERACLPAPGRPAPVELHALYCGDMIVATFGGLAHARRFSGLLISYALEGRFARSSPGELLLVAVIRAKCAEGFEGFDLGVGEARYKECYCPIADRLIDGFLPLTLAGHLATTGQAIRLRLKSAIKRSPRAWATVQRMRKRLGRWRRPMPA